METIHRFSSLRERLDHAFLADKLRDAKSYKRIAGYFRSSILELVGEEIGNIPNVRIVCNSELDPHDIIVSQAAREAALKERWNQIPIETEALLYRAQYQKLYQLLVSGRVKIKVVPKSTVFVHGKAGVIELADGNKTCFLGSVNESLAAFSKNHEILWEDTSPEGCNWVEQEFEMLWERGYDLPEAIITEVRRIGERIEVRFDELAPNEIPAAAMVESPIYRGGEQLQPWQRSFVSTFLQHRTVYGKARLLIADEVGLGKTLSLATAALVASLLGDGPVLILCPATLTFQWQAEINDRLGVPAAVWASNAKQWIDPSGRALPSRGVEDIARCPFQIAIVSTGLIVHGADEALALASLKFGTIILDEAHKARLRGGLGKSPEPNNLLSFMRDVARNTRHVLLGTATPIQTTVRELWDLLAMLNQGAEFVMGRDYVSSWINWEETHPVIIGNAGVTDEETAWNLLKAPLPSRDTPMMDADARQLIRVIRNDLQIPDATFFTDAGVTALGRMTRSLDLRRILDTDFFRRNNPFIRHVVIRRREILEREGLLEKIAVSVHPDPHARQGRYPGVVFEGLGLMTNHSFELAYAAAEGFVTELGKRTKGAQLLRSVFLQRICSSFESGRLTVSRMLKKQLDAHQDDELQREEQKVLDTLTDKEMELLRTIQDELSRGEAVDPKLNAVKLFLQQFRSDGQTWAEWGCIVFSQYYDTANWVALELSTVFPDRTVAVYAGSGKSGLYRENRFVNVDRDHIKKLVKEREVSLVVATDAACEGLNLQTLGTLINIDLPWNPARLEQRLGRIKRFGQARKTVDMLNLTYHATRDEDVYAKISERLRDRFDIFGGLPDCIEDDWIEDFEGFAALADTHLHMREQVTNIFESTWAQTMNPDGERWDECSRVLSRKDVYEMMSRPWGRR